MSAPLISAGPARVYTWTFPGCPLEVSLDLKTVEAIQGSSWSTSESKQGILLGEKVSGHTHVTGFLPAQDLEAGFQTAGSYGVGIYHMRPDGNLQMTAEEATAAQTLLQQPGTVALIVEPREAGAAQATFYYFELGLLCGGSMHFPFDATALAERKPLALAPAPKPQPVALPSPPRPRRAWRIGVIGVLLLGAMALGAALTLRLRPTVPTASPTASLADDAAAAVEIGRVDLRVQRQGSDLKITWDPASGTPKTAGLLSITDGSTHRLLPLAPDQLRFGSLLYTPASTQVKVDLTLSHGDQVDARGSVLVLLNSESPKIARQDLAPPQATPQQKPDPPPSQPRPTRPFRSTLSTANRVAPDKVDLPLPPALAAAPQPAPNMPVPGVNLLPQAPPSYSATASRSTPGTVSYVEAVPVYKVIPVEPPELRAVLGQETRAHVRVRIDEKGRVSRADAVIEKGVHQLLLGAAVKAAYGWRFTPARLGDRPMPSETLLEFRFLRK